MKHYNKYLIILLSIMTVQSCKKDFLDRPPIDQLTVANFYKTDEEVMAGTAPLYNIVWFDFNDKAFLAFGEARGGNLNSNDRTAYIQHAVSATDVNQLLPGYKSFYKIIAQSNITMQSIINSSDISTPIRRMGIAECRFMRAIAHFYLVMNWGAVPIVYDNIKQLGTPPRRNNIEDVWKFIITDFRFAAENLPPTAVAQGRLTKWAAEGMLAKAYLYRSGLGAAGATSRRQSDLDSAKLWASDVVNNSGINLYPSYSGLFRSATNNSSNNNPEGLFSIQWMPFSEPWGINNSFQAYMAYESGIPNTGDGWGAAQGVSADVVKYFIANPDDAIRRKEICMFNGDKYPELKQASGGLDYAVTNISNIKKYVIGSPQDNGNKGGFMCAYINTYMLRLAEVYLIYAEAILGNNASTTDAEALKFFNLVRTRAGMPTKSSLTFADIFQEKRVETIMEGNAWYEIVRWYYFDRPAAEAYVAAQDKGSYTINYVTGSNNPRQYTVTYTPEYFPVTESTLYLPYPEAELINAPSLNNSPVAFDFSVLQ